MAKDADPHASGTQAGHDPAWPAVEVAPLALADATRPGLGAAPAAAAPGEAILSDDLLRMLRDTDPSAELQATVLAWVALFD